MKRKIFSGIIVFLFIAISAYYASAWEKSIINITGYNNNRMDTHMCWDGTYLWIPETEYVNCHEVSIISNNLIRYNPIDNEVISYSLPLLQDYTTILYEVVPGKDPNTLYISAPYGKNKAIYIFDKATGVAEMYTPPDMFSGSNGAKMAVTNMDNIDYVWTTGVNGKIVKFKADDQTSDSFNFSEYGGFYGIAAVPTDIPNVWTIFAASLNTGNLLMFPSDSSDINDSNINILNIGDELGLDHSVLTSMHYDGTHVWMAISSNDIEKHGFVRYTPSTVKGELGDYSVHWTEAFYYGTIPTMTDFKGHMWMTIEEFNKDGCDYDPSTTQNPQLVVLDKNKLITESIPLPEFTNLNRASTSLGNCNDYIYVGGYGYNDTGSVLNLLRVTPQPLSQDSDGVSDDEDNCPTIFNPDQEDADNDGIGNVCDDEYYINLTVLDLSGTYTESRDGMTLNFILSHDTKGKLTGSGTFDYLSDENDMSIDVEIKGKVKGKNNIVTLKYKVIGKNAEKDKIQNNLKLELVEDNETTFAGTEKWKICQKGSGCVKGDGEVSLDAPDGMTREAVLSIDVELDENGKKLGGEARLFLSNDEEYSLYVKGKYNSNKNETPCQLKGIDEFAKGIKIKLKIDEGSEAVTFIRGKALGQQLKYK